MAYVDVEGLGDKGKAYDVHLIAPLLLVSKVLIYNWKGAPNKHVMLDSLHTLGEAAQRVNNTQSAAAAASAATADGGDGGGGGAGGGPIFGHLVVVLRDWHTTDEVYSLLFEAEAEPKHGDDAIRARNLARSLVLGAFESISVRCLPFPGLHGGDAALTRLSGGFVRQYQALQAHLVDLS